MLSPFILVGFFDELKNSIATILICRQISDIWDYEFRL